VHRELLEGSAGYRAVVTRETEEEQLVGVTAIDELDALEEIEESA
jgi:hypothetical protein